MAAQVNTVPKGMDYVVLSLINNNTQIEWIGGDSYPFLQRDNAELAAAYGSHYLDVWKVLVDSYDPTLVTDVSDHKHGEVPTSLRAIVAAPGTTRSGV